MPDTVKDIVKKAEISHSTVSRALDHHLPVARLTVEQIRRRACEKNCATSQFTRSSKAYRSHK